MKKLILVTVLVTSIAFTSTAYAEENTENNYYVGISVGNPSSKDEDDLSSKDEKKGMLKLFGGYEFNENVALEGHYSNKITDISDNRGDTYKMKSYGISAIYKIPFESITPFIKLGYHKWNFKEVEVGVPVVSTSGNDLFFGLGASISLNDKIDFRIEAERFNYEDSEKEKIRTNLYSVGIVYKF